MKKAIVVLAALVLFAWTATMVQAETCYRLEPFIDVLRLNVQILEGPIGGEHQLAYGNWIASGFYTLPVVGARELDKNSTSTRRLGIHGTNDTEFFGANPICILDGIPDGAWFLVCTGAVGGTGGVGVFTNNGPNLASISCTEAPASIGIGTAAGASR
jgi:hypothetical protein